MGVNICQIQLTEHDPVRQRQFVFALFHLHFYADREERGVFSRTSSNNLQRRNTRRSLPSPFSLGTWQDLLSLSAPLEWKTEKDNCDGGGYRLCRTSQSPASVEWLGRKEGEGGADADADGGRSMGRSVVLCGQRTNERTNELRSFFLILFAKPDAF